MNIKITNGDVIRHCNNEELARVMLLKSVQMVLEVLSAMSETENLLKFYTLCGIYEEELVKEQAAWLARPVQIPPQEE